MHIVFCQGMATEIRVIQPESWASKLREQLFKISLSHSVFRDSAVPPAWCRQGTPFLTTGGRGPGLKNSLEFFKLALKIL